MSCSRKITKWLIVISGFMQNRGKPTGMTRLWLDLGDLQDAHTKVLLLNWSDDVSEYAEMIWSIAQNGGRREPIIRVFAYSWGSSTAMDFARALQRRGMKIDAMVLSDPVFRHWWILRRWTSLLSWMTLKVPANVGKVHWYRQRNNRPCGHDLVAENALATTIYPAKVLEGIEHQYMDDAWLFHEECKACAAA